MNGRVLTTIFRSRAQKTLSLLLCAWLLSAFHGPTSSAQSDAPIEFELAANVGAGSTQSMAVYGSYLVLGLDGGLALVDPSAVSEQPRVVSRLALEPTASITNLVVDDAHAFLTTYDGRALIVDLSNTNQPKQIGIFDPPGGSFEPSALEVVGGLAYLSTRSGSMLIYDLGSLEEPQLLGSIALDLEGRQVSDLDIDRGHAYLSAGSELVIVDVSDPAAPTQVMPPLPRPPSGNWRGLLIEEGIGYAGTFAGGLVVLDLSDPAAPTILSQLYVPFDQGRRGRLREPVKQGSFLLFPAERDGLVSINVSDPAAPFIESTLLLPGRDASKVLLDQQHVYVMDRNLGLHVLDAADPSLPTLTRSLEWPSQMVGVHVRQGFAAAVSRFGRLLVYDVQDPYAPKEVSRLKLSDVEQPQGMAVLGSFAYIFAMDYETLSRPQARVQVVDLSNPYEPVLHRRINLSTNHSITSALCGKRLYFGGQHGAAVFDLDEEGGIKLDEWWVENAVELQHLACSQDGLYAISNSPDTNDPQLLTFDTRPGAAFEPASRQALAEMKRPGPLMVVGERLVVATTGGLSLFDLSSPLMPALMPSDFSTHHQLQGTQAMARQGDLLFLAGSPSALTAVDFSEPASPLIRGQLSIALFANAMAIEGSTMVIGSGSSGITTVEILGAEIEPPTPSPTPRPPSSPIASATPENTATPVPAPAYLPLLVTRRR